MAPNGEATFLEANPNGQWMFLDPLFHARSLNKLLRRSSSLQWAGRSMPSDEGPARRTATGASFGCSVIRLASAGAMCRATSAGPSASRSRLLRKFAGSTPHIRR